MRHAINKVRLRRLAARGLLLAALAGGGCSMRHFASRQFADVVAGGGVSFASDDDPELVKAAAPFSLKLLESLLADNPEHAGLLSAAASGFTQYAFAFVQQDADELEARDLAAAEALRTRARRLYLRAQRYGMRGLEVRHAGLARALAADPPAAVRRLRQDDVPLAYWTAAAWGAAIALAKDQPEQVAQLPAVAALMDQALKLDEGYGRGAIHTFLITYEMSRRDGTGDPVQRARRHFERAVALTGGQDAAPFVALAEAVCVQKQEVREFEALLARALAIDPDAHPETRLMNLVMQRRARWLLAQKPELFLTTNHGGG